MHRSYHRNCQVCGGRTVGRNRLRESLYRRHRIPTDISHDVCCPPVHANVPRCREPSHGAHKAEQAVDLETSTVLAVTLEGASVGDTATLAETVMEAADQTGDGRYQPISEQAVGSRPAEGVGLRIITPTRSRKIWRRSRFA